MELVIYQQRNPFSISLHQTLLWWFCCFGLSPSHLPFLSCHPPSHLPSPLFLLAPLSFHLPPSPLPPDHSPPTLLDLSSFSCSCSSFIYFLRKGLSYYHIAQSGLELNILPRIASNSEQSSCLSQVPTSDGITAVSHHIPVIFKKFILSSFSKALWFCYN